VSLLTPARSSMPERSTGKSIRYAVPASLRHRPKPSVAWAFGGTKVRWTFAFYRLTHWTFLFRSYPTELPGHNGKARIIGNRLGAEKRPHVSGLSWRRHKPGRQFRARAEEIVFHLALDKLARFRVQWI